MSSAISSHGEASSGALHGFTVLDLTRTAAGALATMMLGDHGARVIRLCGDDEDSSRGGGFLVWDRGKERYRFDIDDPDLLNGEAFERLLRGADVLVEDMPPSAAGRSAFEPGRLAAINPALVSCSITAIIDEFKIKRFRVHIVLRRFLNRRALHLHRSAGSLRFGKSDIGGERRLKADRSKSHEHHDDADSDYIFRLHDQLLGY